MTAGEPAMTGSERVDQALVTRGLARSRAVARDLVEREPERLWEVSELRAAAAAGVRSLR